MREEPWADRAGAVPTMARVEQLERAGVKLVRSMPLARAAAVARREAGLEPSRGAQSAA